MTSVTAFNQKFDVSSYSSLDLQNFTFLLTVNLQIIYLLNTNHEFRRFTSDAKLCFDGVLPLQLSKLIKSNDYETLTGSSAIFDLLRDDRTRNYKFLLIGAEPDVNRKAVDRANIEFGREAYGYSPKFADEMLLEDKQNLSKLIEESRPEVVLLGLDTVKANRWIFNNMSVLKSSGVKFVSGFGGAIDLLGRKLKPCPPWMNRLGLEWLFRTFQQPSIYRLKRIYVSLIALRFLIFSSKI